MKFGLPKFLFDLEVRSERPVISDVICKQAGSRCVTPNAPAVAITTTAPAAAISKSSYWGGSEDCAGSSDLFLGIPSVSLCSAWLGSQQIAGFMDCYDELSAIIGAKSQWIACAWETVRDFEPQERLPAAGPPALTATHCMSASTSVSLCTTRSVCRSRS